MSKFVQQTWFPATRGGYGFVSALMGHDFTTPTFWLGLGLAVVAYVGASMESRQ